MCVTREFHRDPAVEQIIVNLEQRMGAFKLPARVSASEYVEPKHLLLGLMREDKALSAKFIGTFTAVESNLCDV